MSKCFICPRECGADRDQNEKGFCGMPADIYVAKIMRHEWEEPCICAHGGAGAVFFSGCNLRCVYCQNRDISRGAVGRSMTEAELEEAILGLQEEGVQCIDLVTPTHYVDKLTKILKDVKPKLHIPVVYNCGGYEKIETLKKLNGLVDVYMPDIKYFSPELAGKYSSAANYFEIASAALYEMYLQVGKPEYAENGDMKSGIIMRHLVLPGGRHDSVRVLEEISKIIPPKDVVLSLMSQYTPEFASDSGYRELGRRITAFEYNYVLDAAISLGYDGFMQDRSSAKSKYTPEFK